MTQLRAAELVAAADLIGLSPGSRLGRTGELDVPKDLLDEDFLAAQDRLADGTVNDN